MHLNNAGTYYDIYYTHPQEIAGITWLQAHTGGQKNGVQPAIQTDRYTFAKLQTFTDLKPLSDDIYPTLVRREAFVFLGYQNVRLSESTVSFSGDLVNVRLPVEVLGRQQGPCVRQWRRAVYR